MLDNARTEHTYDVVPKTAAFSAKDVTSMRRTADLDCNPLAYFAQARELFSILNIIER